MSSVGLSGQLWNHLLYPKVCPQVSQLIAFHQSFLEEGSIQGLSHCHNLPKKQAG